MTGQDGEELRLFMQRMLESKITLWPMDDRHLDETRRANHVLFAERIADYRA